jgi:hypothetical protein
MDKPQHPKGALTFLWISLGCITLIWMNASPRR